MMKRGLDVRDKRSIQQLVQIIDIPRQIPCLLIPDIFTHSRYLQSKEKKSLKRRFIRSVRETIYIDQCPASISSSVHVVATHFIRSTIPAHQMLISAAVGINIPPFIKSIKQIPWSFFVATKNSSTTTTPVILVFNSSCVPTLW